MDGLRFGRFAGALFLLVLVALARPAWAQITTSTVSGTVKDQQGAVVPGATVILISDTKQSMLPPVVSNEAGDFVVTNVFADTYTIQIEMPSFKTLKRAGVQVSAGTPVTVGSLTLEVGGASEIVTVTSEAPLIQASSGERSFAVSSAQVENLPVTTRSFDQYAAMAPGVADNLQRIGGGGQTNVMMDGVSTMDTGNNGIILRLTNESIAEVKVVTSGYQAEFGRSSGLQVSVVSKSGTNQFHGGFYDIERSSDWNSNSKANILNGDPKAKLRQRDWGYSIGGPVGKAGSNNKLFFFYTQEFSPRTAGNDVVRFRLPTALERAGDFSQTYDNNGNLYPYIKDPLLPGACSAATQAGCFADGGVVGRIPANRLYEPGLNILKQWPMPNISGAGLAYNYQITRPEENLMSMQPVVRLDYQPLDRLRGSFKVARWMQDNIVFNGTIPGFNDAKQNHPVVSLYAVTVDYTVTPTMVLEGTYGRSQNERAGCTPGGQVGPIFCTAGIGNQAGIPMAPIANLNNAGLQNLPLLYPDAHIINPDYYAYYALTELVPSPVFVNGRVQKAPNFAFGNRIAAANAPPNIPWPNYLNINPTHDVALSLTKVTGSHTMKAGLYINRSFKAENQGNNAFGTLSFANEAVGSNPFDTSFGFANAAVGSFASYTQSAKYIEGNVVYRNIEWYLQDSWKVNNRMTLDMGIRFTNQGPTHDILGQESNFFPEDWNASAAPVLYLPGCANGVSPCSGDNRQAYNPVTKTFLGAGSAGYIGSLVPNTGDRLNGIITQTEIDQLGTYGYKYPLIGVAPRFGMAYDLTGDQKIVLRGSGGIFFDRPSVTQFQQNNNPPNAETAAVVRAQLQSLGSVGIPIGIPQLTVIKYESGLPSSAQWNGGVQMQLPHAFVLDTAYVGQRSWNLVQSPNLNSVDLGAAFLPQNQDPTLAASATPGAAALSGDFLRAMRGYGSITQRADPGWRTYHSLQVSLQRRMTRGLSFGFADTISVSDRQNAPVRYQHNAAGQFSVMADQAQADELLGDSLTPKHTMRGNAIWQLPTIDPGQGTRKVVAAIVNDWQIAGVWNGLSGTPYSVALATTYQNGVSTSTNVTGSPDFQSRARLSGDTGGGCSGDIYRQFNAGAFLGPLVNSAGLESSNNYLTGCFISTIDMSLSRTVRLGGSKTVQFRMDVFNLPNSGIITARNSTVTFASPTDNTITNLPYDANGNLVAARSRPATAGFGMATTFQNPRSIQFQARFGF